MYNYKLLVTKPYSNKWHSVYTCHMEEIVNSLHKYLLDKNRNDIEIKFTMTLKNNKLWQDTFIKEARDSFIAFYNLLLKIERTHDKHASMQLTPCRSMIC